MRNRILFLGAALVIALAWTSLSREALAEEPPGEQPQSEWAPYPEDETAAAAAQAQAAINLLLTSSGSCDYSTWADWPHLSRNRRDISAHGWWEDDSSGQCPRYADVEVWIEAHRCTLPDYGSCWWEIIASNEERVRARDLSGQWVNARRRCATSERTGYRTVVDVDLVGQSDPPDKVYTIPRNVACRPAP